VCIICLLDLGKGGFISYLWCVQIEIEKNEMGGACGAYGGGERGAQGVGGET
jgi:hypothetical protein